MSTDLTAARFHVGDTVTVDFSGTADPILEHVEPIKEDGTITLPYIGPVRALARRRANCKTTFMICMYPSIMSG